MSAAGFLDTLDEDQLRAATHDGVPARVESGPGGGKTRTVTGRNVYLIAVQEVPAAQIAVVSFTNKAVNEIRERLARRFHAISA